MAHVWVVEFRGKKGCFPSFLHSYRYLTRKGATKVSKDLNIKHLGTSNSRKYRVRKYVRVDESR